MQFHSRIYPSTVNKKSERSDLENIKQKNDRYSKFDQYKFYENFQTKNDLQGWRNKLIDLIPKKNQNINIADLGCGLGDKALRLIKNINKQFSKLYLIDYAVNSTKIFEDIYKDNKVRIFHLDVLSALNKIEDNSLDVILCVEVIEHVENPLLVFKEFSRLLKKDGKLILTAPFNSLTHYAPYHYSTGFSKYYYEKHLPEYGFQIIELKSNGNYFEYFAQETRRLSLVSKQYSNVKVLSPLFYLSRLYFLNYLKRQSKKDSNSDDLLCFGYNLLIKKL